MPPQASRGHGVRQPVFELVASKLNRPLIRPGTVRRSSLIDRLERGEPRPIVSVVAVAVNEKTTLLSQWAERSSQAFAWVSVDEADNDPKVLLTYVAYALDAIEPVGRRVFDALASPASSVPGSVVPRLGSAFASMTSPVVLVLDDAHLLHNSECRAALSVLADHVPAGSRLAFAAREEPPVRVARLRAEGRILEIGPGELSLTRDEAAALLRAADVTLGEADVTELHQRTEGWAAGLYLAALAIRENGSPGSAAASFGGSDQLVGQYVESQLLARINRQRREFLTRTAVLERMSGPLCDAVLDTHGSAPVLADLAKSNLLLVPLDRHGQWYRYHHLFRDMLLAELERLEFEMIPGLRRRAADWFLSHDQPEAALEYYIAAGDVDAAARLVERLWLPTDRQGRHTTLRRWFRWLEDHGGVEGHPFLPVGAAFLFQTAGPPAEAERWADVVDRWQHEAAARAGDPATEAWAALLRACLCRHGVERMRADADEAAARKAAAPDLVAPAITLMQGIARILCGDLGGGEAFLEDAASAGADVGSHEVFAITLAERSLVAIACGDWGQAEAFASQADTVLRHAGIEDGYATPLVYAVRARTAWHRADMAAAQQQLSRAQRLRPALTYALPHLAVQARLELIRVCLALGDLMGARTLMREIDEVLRRRPLLGTLVGEARALRTQLSKRRGYASPRRRP